MSRTITVYPLPVNKKPVGYADWPQEEKPRPKKKRKKK